MKSDSMVATEKMLDVINILLDEQRPDFLFPKILEVAQDVLQADAAVLDIAGEKPLHLTCPENVSISISAIRLAKSENKAVVWNQLDDDSADLSKSIVQNQLTSIMVSPFRTPDSESGYLYLQRAAREEPFTDDDSQLFDAFVAVCEKFAFAAFDRLRDKESLDVLKNVKCKGNIVYSSKIMDDVIALADKHSVAAYHLKNTTGWPTKNVYVIGGGGVGYGIISDNGDNIYGFSVNPSDAWSLGEYLSKNGSVFAAFWTSTENPSDENYVYHIIISNEDKAYSGNHAYQKNEALAVRCIMD